MIMSTRPQTPHDGMLAWLLGGRGLGGPAAGYATFADYNSAVCLPLSAAVKCPVPFDPTCVTPAQAAVAACQNAWVTDPASCHNVVCDASGQPAVTAQPLPQLTGTSLVRSSAGSGTVIPPPRLVGRPVVAPTYSAQLSFVGSRPGMAFQVGDTWQISITGAPPNTPVSVTGGKTGAQITNTMGTTDGAGNFSISGTFTPDQVATWSEVWQVGESRVGSLIAFTVSPSTNTKQINPPTMPTLPSSACQPGQTYIPPGSAFTAGPTAGQITPTGACQDPASYYSSSGGGPSVDFGPLSVPFSELSNTVQIGSWNIPYWGLGLGAAGLLFLIVRSATK